MKFGALLMAGAMALQAMGGFPATAEAKEIDITDVTLTGIVQEVTETEVTLRVMGEKPEDGERPESKHRGKQGEKPAEATETAAETTEIAEGTQTETAENAEKPERKGGKRHGKRGEKPAETTEAAETTETTESAESTETEKTEEGRGKGGRRGGRGHGRGRGHRRGGKGCTVTLTVSAELLTDIEKGDHVTITTDANGAVTALTENAKPERPNKKEDTAIETAEEAETSEA